MSCRNDKNFHEEYEEYNEEEEEDKKCPAKLHVSWLNPNEGHKPGNASLVYKEEGEDTKCPPQHVHEYVNQPSMDESSNHEKAHREFAQKDKETIKMEEGVFCAEWETFNEAAYGQVPGSNPNERGLSIEATKVAHGTSCGRHAVSSSKGPGPDDSPGPGPDASPGAEAVDGRAHLPNNAHRPTHAFPPTRPGAERVPGPDCKRLDEDEDQMTIVSHEESMLPIVPEAERVNTEEDERRRQAEINQAMNDFIATTPVADVVPDNNGRRQKLVGAILLVILIATVIGVVLGIMQRPEPVPPPDYNASLSSVSSDKGEALRNSSTPQYKAFNWVVTNNTHLAASSIELIIQRYALATFFYSTNGNSWDDNTDWLSEGKECLWRGLKCTTCTPSDEVYELDLVVKKNGEFAGNNLGGTIPPEIGLLSALVLLSLWNNTLEGTIPSEVGQLTKLASLDLSWNMLTGTLLSEIGMLSDSLASLDLSGNLLTGSLLSEIGELTKLTALSLGFNKLIGTIPAEIGELTKLTALSLLAGGLTGTIFPTEMGLLTKLVGLELDANILTGTIPPSIVTFTDLDFLDFAENYLTGTIPTELGLLTKMTYLSLGSNRFTGTIPSELGLLTKLAVLSLGSNGFTGTIPRELGLLTKLVVLSLGSVGFTGTIPSELGLLTELIWLDLNTNLFTGTVPTTLASLPLLKSLFLNDNDLTGSLDAFCGMELADFAVNTCFQEDAMNCSCCNACCDIDGACYPI